MSTLESQSQARDQYLSPIAASSEHAQSAPPCSTPASQQLPSEEHSFRPKRTSAVAFESSLDGGSDCILDEALVSPALTIENAHKRSDAAPALNEHAPLPLPQTQPQEQHADSLLSVWSSAFTTPSRVIKNTANNKRKWSKRSPTVILFLANVFYQSGSPPGQHGHSQCVLYSCSAKSYTPKTLRSQLISSTPKSIISRGEALR